MAFKYKISFLLYDFRHLTNDILYAIENTKTILHKFFTMFPDFVLH